MTYDTAVVARHVQVVRSGRPVLRDVSFSIGRGRITGLMGPSGSGKTTLLRTIVGTQALHAGELVVLQQSAGSAGLRSKIGYVTQAPAIYNDLTVQQNIHYFARIANRPLPVERVVRDVDLAAQAHQLAGQLSGGQKARVSLAVALVGNPDILVLDEPTVGLDPLLRKKLWKLFETLVARGKTLIVSSHAMDEAVHCDDVLLLREGQIIAHGTRQDLLKQTRTRTFEDAFVATVGSHHA